jgi:hypothetical protein
MGNERGRRKASPVRDERQRILILCEGKCTEPQYLSSLRRKLRVPEQNLKLLCPPEIPNTPREMVEEAKRRKRDKQESFDQVWCVFDVEAKLTQKCRVGFREAVNSATDAKIGKAISNPCFEIWLCWHKADQTAWISSDAIQGRCKELGLTAGKQIQDVGALVQDWYEVAKNRACSLVQTHERDGRGRLEEMNPYSGVYLLIDAIYAAFPPRT